MVEILLFRKTLSSLCFFLNATNHRFVLAYVTLLIFKSLYFPLEQLQTMGSQLEKQDDKVAGNEEYPEAIRENGIFKIPWGGTNPSGLTALKWFMTSTNRSGLPGFMVSSFYNYDNEVNCLAPLNWSDFFFSDNCYMINLKTNTSNMITWFLSGQDAALHLVDCLHHVPGETISSESVTYHPWNDWVFAHCQG